MLTVLLISRQPQHTISHNAHTHVHSLRDRESKMAATHAHPHDRSAWHIYVTQRTKEQPIDQNWENARRYKRCRWQRQRLWRWQRRCACASFYLKFPFKISLASTCFCVQFQYCGCPLSSWHLTSLHAATGSDFNRFVCLLVLAYGSFALRVFQLPTLPHLVTRPRQCQQIRAHLANGIWYIHVSTHTHTVCIYTCVFYDFSYFLFVVLFTNKEIRSCGLRALSASFMQHLWE